MSFNQMMVIGNLTKDPTFKNVGDGLSVCKFSIAQSETIKGKNGEKKQYTEYFNIECWGPLAKTCAQFLSTGASVFVVGKFTSHKYTKENGEQGVYNSINTKKIRFLSPKKSQNSNTSYENDEKLSDNSEIDLDDALMYSVSPDVRFTTEEIPF